MTLFVLFFQASGYLIDPERSVVGGRCSLRWGETGGFWGGVAYGVQTAVNNCSLIRKSLLSVIFPPAGKAAPILGAPGMFWLFL